MPKGDADTIFNLADQVALISCEVLRFRLRNKQAFSLAQQLELENLEEQLDTATAQLRAMGMAAIAAATTASLADVQSATETAEALLRRIKKIERGLDIATSVLNLALAVIGKNPKTMLNALAGLKKTVGEALG